VFVFGYGSLLNDRRGEPCRLEGHRRCWDVAMDNRDTVPGYKVYVDPETGEQPAVHVAYLSISPHPRAHVNGVALEISEEELATLDRRERNYDRREVGELIDTDLDGPVWAYVGSPQGRRRLADGRADGTAVVSEGYLDGVRQGFEALGLLDEFEATTGALDLPVVPLLRRDVGA
jgi:cation transport regulator ChaC